MTGKAEMSVRAGNGARTGSRTSDVRIRYRDHKGAGKKKPMGELCQENGGRRGYEDEGDRGGYRMSNVGLCRPGRVHDPPFQRQPLPVTQA